jgi:hypothetical protein
MILLPAPATGLWVPALRRSVKYAAPRPGHELAHTAAMQSISMSNGPNHCGTQTKIRAGGLVGKYRSWIALHRF